MSGSRIIDYTESWRSQLRHYLQVTFPTYSEAYIDYCLDRSNERIPSKMVINESGNVVGCHLYYCTKACICGEVIDTQWGHDTYLDKEYRAEMGLDLMLLTHSIKGFGLGLTDVNEKLQKKLKKVFFQGTNNYYTITWSIFLTPFQRAFHTRPNLFDKEYISVGEYVFKRVYDASEITIPNDGFWFKKERDIDFIRDADFINQRFIKNKVHNYEVYAFQDNGITSYFVVRTSMFLGLPVLLLSDFRYFGGQDDLAEIILKATKKIAAKSKIGVVIILCGDELMDKAIKKGIYRARPYDFVSSMRVKSDMTYIVTGADSDGDFLK